MLVRWARQSKMVKALGLVALLTTLTAGRLPLQSARSVLVPMDTNAPLGTPFKVKVGDSIVASRFMRWNLVRLDRKVTVSIDRFSQDVSTDLDLEGVGATQGSAKRTGLNSNHYYCSAEIKAHSDLSYQLVASVFSNVEQYVRFCFADENADGLLDHVFLGGAKSQELQAAHEIEPVPFHTLELTPDAEGTQFHLTLKRIEADRNNLLIYLRPMRDGKESSWGRFSLWDVKTGAETPFKDKLNVAYGTEKPVPLLNVAGYDLTVISVDPAAGEATFMLNRASEPMFYQSTEPSVQMIFIYI